MLELNKIDYYVLYKKIAEILEENVKLDKTDKDNLIKKISNCQVKLISENITESKEWLQALLSDLNN